MSEDNRRPSRVTRVRVFFRRVFGSLLCSRASRTINDDAPAQAPATNQDNNTATECKAPAAHGLKIDLRACSSTNEATTLAAAAAKRHSECARDSLASWEIPESELHVDKSKTLGVGTFGTVYTGEYRPHGKVAVKYLHVALFDPDENKLRDKKKQYFFPPNFEHFYRQYDSFRQEMHILKALRHPNVLELVGCLLYPRLAIVTELCASNSLYNFLHTQQQDETADADQSDKAVHELAQIALQIARGMDYIHERGVLHRDLKSQNVLLVPVSRVVRKWRPKIGDFGLSTFAVRQQQHQPAKQLHAKPNASASSSSPLSPPPLPPPPPPPQPTNNANPIGSLLWMPPEVARTRSGQQMHTRKSDVYSYGVILYELFSGQQPFHHAVDKYKEPHVFLFMLGRRRLTLPLDEVRERGAPEQVTKLVELCTKLEAADRPEFTVVRQVCETVCDQFVQLELNIVKERCHKEPFVDELTVVQQTYKKLKRAWPSEHSIRELLRLQARVYKHNVVASVASEPSPTSGLLRLVKAFKPSSTIAASKQASHSSLSVDCPLTPTTQRIVNTSLYPTPRQTPPPP